MWQVYKLDDIAAMNLSCIAILRQPSIQSPKKLGNGFGLFRAELGALAPTQNFISNKGIILPLITKLTGRAVPRNEGHIIAQRP